MDYRQDIREGRPRARFEKAGLPGILFFMALFLAGCFGENKPPAEGIRTGPLAFIVVYSGNVPFGQSGTSADGLNIPAGASVTLSAQGRDYNNRPIRILPVWTASKPDVVELTPAGDMVELKGLRAGKVEIAAEYSGVRKTVNYIFVK